MKLNLFGFLLIFTFSCQQQKKSEVIKTYPPYIIESFTKGCTKDAQDNIEQTLLCSCLIEKIQEEYPIDTYLKIGENGSGKEWDKLQDFMLKTGKKCLTKE